MIKFPWTVKTHPSNWNNQVDAEGSRHLKIKLIVMIPKPPNANLGGQRFMETSIQALQADFAKLCNDASSADITIVCSDDVELTAHKLIL